MPPMDCLGLIGQSPFRVGNRALYHILSNKRVTPRLASFEFWLRMNKDPGSNPSGSTRFHWMSAKEVPMNTYSFSKSHLEAKPKCCVPACCGDGILFKFQPGEWGDTPLARDRTKRWIRALQVAPRTTRIFWICRRHFQSGRPARLRDPKHPDWVPTKHLSNIQIQAEKLVEPKVPLVELSDEDAEEKERHELVSTAMRLLKQQLEEEQKKCKVKEKWVEPEVLLVELSDEDEAMQRLKQELEEERNKVKVETKLADREVPIVEISDEDDDDAERCILVATAMRLFKQQLREEQNTGYAKMKQSRKSSNRKRPKK